MNRLPRIFLPWRALRRVEQQRDALNASYEPLRATNRELATENMSLRSELERLRGEFNRRTTLQHQELDALRRLVAVGPWPIGTAVVKLVGDYRPPGEYRGAVTNRKGRLYVVVEHDHGLLHIYTPAQIGRRGAAEVAHAG